MDTEANPIIAGEFSGQINFAGVPLSSDANPGTVFMAKFESADGAHVYSKEFTQTGEGRAFAVAARGGRLFITGQFRGSIDFGGGPFSAVENMDGFVARFRE